MATLPEAYVSQIRSPGASEHWSGPPEMVERIADTTGTTSRHRVLDLGCGIGGPARRLARLVRCEVLGIDVLEPVVRAARARGSPVRYVVGRAEAVPLDDATVDRVWILGALAHFVDLERCLSEVARVLRPGGLVAATEALWTGRDEPAFAVTAPRPWRPLTEREALQGMARAGLREVRSLPWPGGGSGEPPVPSDRRLAEDLAAGRLRSSMVLGVRP